MKLEQGTNVIYVTPEGDQVFTFIRAVNDKEGFYILDFEGRQVVEDKVRLNTHSIFSVPRNMIKDHIKAYQLDQLIDQIVKYLNEHHDSNNLNIYREMNTVYFETTFKKPQPLEEKNLFHAEIERFNKMIGQVNDMVKSRFNEKIEVILRSHFQNHLLHTIRV